MPGSNSSPVHLDLHKNPEKKSRGWYLSLMAPNEKGPSYAWLDPSRLYCHQEALQDCIEDLLQPFNDDQIDLVVGIDAMGFILGDNTVLCNRTMLVKPHSEAASKCDRTGEDGECEYALNAVAVFKKVTWSRPHLVSKGAANPGTGAAIAAHLGKGFLAIRKSGHLCVKTYSQSYVDYSKREKCMEIRTDAIKPGLRILLVDQWIETGGTMSAAIKLVENQGGVVAGVATICIEDSDGGKWVRENYKCSDCVPDDMRSQFNGHFLESFHAFHNQQSNS